MRQITSPVSGEDAALARNWQRHAAGDWGKAGRAEELTEEQQLRRQLDRLRTRRPAVYDWLIANDDRARRIAIATGWVQLQHDPATLEQRMQADWGSITPEQIGRKLIAPEQLASTPPNALIQTPGKMADAWLALLRSAVEKYAPQHAHLVPERIIAAEVVQDNVVPLRAAAIDITAEFRRGPIIEDEPP